MRLVPSASRCVLVALLLTAASCTKSTLQGSTATAGGSTTGGGSSNDGGCVPDPVLLAATTSCHFDDQCPCGAHCVLGLCAADCQADAQCGFGSYCDPFGRCRLQADTGLFSLTPVQQPSIGLRPSTLTITSADTSTHAVQVIVNYPGPTDGGTVRMHADEGLLLDCSLDAGLEVDDAGDCVFEQGAPARVGVSLDPDAGDLDGGALEVHVFAGDQIQTLTVNSGPAPAANPNAPAVAGEYTGAATLLGILDAPAGDAGGVPRQVIPLTAQVGAVGGKLVLQITDVTHSLAPFDSWAAPLAGSPGHYTLAFPEYRAFAGSLLADSTLVAPGYDAGADVEVMIVPAQATVAVSGGSAPAMSFILQLSMTGVAASGPIVAATYEINLGYDPLDAGVAVPVTLDAGDVPVLGAPNPATPTPWGAAFFATWTPLPAVGTNEDGPIDPVAQAIAEGLQDDAGMGGPLDSCLRTDAEFSVLAGEASGGLFADSQADIANAGSGTLLEGHTVGAGSSQYNLGNAINGPAVGFSTPFSGGFNWQNSRSPVMQALSTAITGSFIHLGTTAPVLSATGTLIVSSNLPVASLPPGQIACALDSSAGTISVTWVESCAEFPGFGFPLNIPPSFYCAEDNGAFAASAGGTTPVAIPEKAVDLCDEAAETYGCTPQTLASPLPVSGLGNWVAGGDGDNHLGQMVFVEFSDDFVGLGIFPDTANYTATYDPTQPNSPQLTVTRVCQLPVNPPDCLERATCVNPAPGETDDPTAPDLSTQIRPNTGDLVCQGAARAADFAMDETIAADGGSAPALLAACQQELAAFHSGSVPTPSAPGAQGLFDLLQPAQCLDAARWMEVLEVAAQRSLDQGSLSAAEQSEVHRVLQRWLELDTFIAREEIEREGMANVYAALGLSDPLGPHLSVQSDLDLSLSGLMVLLHPRFAPLLDQLSGAVLASPDYRNTLNPSVTFPNYDQAQGLPVAIVQALEYQVELATVGVNEFWAANNPPDFTKLAPYEKVLRYVMALRPLAVELAERAGPSNPAWYPIFIQESGALDSRVTALVGALKQIRAGQNVLGLDPTEIPLYFQGTAAGAGGEFSAISDYLLGGYPNDTTAWAPALVVQASGDLDAAKAAYSAQATRQLEQAQLNQNADDLRLKYGDEILNLCGNVTDSNGLNLSALDILEHAPATLDGAHCFKVKSKSCQITTNQLFEAYTADDICNQLCIVGEIQKSTGKGAAKMVDPNMEALAEAGGCDVTKPYILKSTPPQKPGQANTWDIVSNKSDVRMNTSSASSSKGAAATGAVETTAEAICKLKFPKGVNPLPSADSIDPGILDASCFQGSLGQEALTLTSIAKNVDIARSEYADQMDAYNIAMQSCLILKKGDTDIESATRSFDSTMTKLRAAKTATDSVADAADAVKDCADSAGNISDDITGASAVSCGASAVKAAAQIASNVLQDQMDEAQASHDALVQTMQANIDEQRCANDASQYLVGQHTQALRIAQAVIDFNVAQNQLEQDEGSVQQLLSEGRQALAAVTSGVAVNPAFDFWLSSDIQAYQKDFALAQRTTFLAVRAAEYEFQASLIDANATHPGTSYTSEVLSARLPQDLTSVTNSLLQVTGTGQVDGNRPSNLSVIISVRDALLQLADQSGKPKSQHGLTPAQRFHELLACKKFAVHDSQGNYLGQQIPFSLAPLGAPGFGQKNTQGISIFAGTSCAERIWSVFAAIEGTGDLFEGSTTTPFVQINLLKSNTFYSQWCSTPSPDGSPFQKSTVNPSLNLFEDPEAGAPGQTSGFGTSNSNKSFTPARLDAYFNVSATDLAQQAYANGQDNELATRGLYGDYALFLPAAELSLPGPAGPSAGLQLDAVDDILLRIDYVSVAKD